MTHEICLLLAAVAYRIKLRWRSDNENIRCLFLHHYPFEISNGVGPTVLLHGIKPSGLTVTYANRSVDWRHIRKSCLQLFLFMRWLL